MRRIVIAFALVAALQVGSMLPSGFAGVSDVSIVSAACDFACQPALEKKEEKRAAKCEQALASDDQKKIEKYCP